MISAPLPENEEERLRWLERLRILDTLEEQAYDDLAYLAAQICEVPIALVSLVDRDRQWFKSHFGLDARETPRDLAFCAHAILADDLFVVEDSSKDLRFHDNPLATGAPHVNFYAGAPLVLRDKVRIGTLCVIDNHARTITEQQKRALEALARQVVSQLELRLKVRELQRLDEAKDEFISMVSHELRTPLTSIKGSLGLLNHQLANGGDAKTVDLVDIAERNSDRLLDMVNDILDVAKLDAGKMQLHLQVLNIVDLAKHAISLNRPYCDKCGCQIDIVLPECRDDLFVEGDKQRVLQVFCNLISNAAKFTRQGDQIVLSVSRDSHGVTVGVTDHGPGIPEQFQSEIFQRFSQVGFRGNAKLPGTGLGLAICKRIVELHGGRIGFESVPDDHTTFYMTLPLVGRQHTAD